MRDHPAPSSTRRRLLIASAVVGVALAVWLNWPRPPALDLPRLAASELGALAGGSDDRHRLLVHLTAQLNRGDRLAPWRQLPAASQPVWSTLLLELAVEGSGAAAFSTEPVADAPGVADAAEGYDVMGAAEMAALLRARPADLARRFAALLPKAQAARLAWIRAHADEIARG